MIELVVVILIIGVLIGGVLASQRFIAKFRITTAQTLTISSPIHGISDSVLWLESSLDKSFKDSESSDTNSLSAWYDVRESVNKNNATQSNSGNYPTYSNSINYIQAVKFDGTNGYFSFIRQAKNFHFCSRQIFLIDEERQSVEDYLGKKWNSTILRSGGSSAASGGIGGSCVGGIVGDSGCLTSCTVIAATGIADTTVAGGSGSLTCNTAANFTGSLPYTCLNGIFAYTNSTACRCADGYNQSGSTCVPVNPECSGGTESVMNISGVNYKFHKFLTTGTSSLNCTVSGTVLVLVVAGGGAAGESRHARPGGSGGSGIVIV